MAKDKYTASSPVEEEASAPEVLKMTNETEMLDCTDGFTFGVKATYEVSVLVPPSPVAACLGFGGYYDHLLSVEAVSIYDVAAELATQVRGQWDAIRIMVDRSDKPARCWCITFEQTAQSSDESDTIVDEYYVEIRRNTLRRR